MKHRKRRRNVGMDEMNNRHQRRQLERFGQFFPEHSFSGNFWRTLVMFVYCALCPLRNVSLCLCAALTQAGGITAIDEGSPFAPFTFVPHVSLSSLSS
jgi:hypothetical protein